MTIFLAILGTAVVTGLLAFAFVMFHHYKGMYEGIAGNYEETLDRAVAAELAREKSEAEMKYLKDIFGNIMSKPVVATMSDKQVQVIVETIMAYLSASQKRPEEMN